METQPINRLSLPPFLFERLQSTAYEFIITGGGGWIGQAALEVLDSAFGDNLGKRVAVYGSCDRTLSLRSGRTVACRELKHIAAANADPKIVLHCAFLTKDRLQDQTVENFVAANEKICDMVASALEKADLHGLFIPSSGAVYKKGTRELDGDLQANAYGVMKIRDELRFTRLASSKNVPLCMPRLFNLAGPFINKLDTYALASMIKCVMANKPIKISAAHHVVRSYVHVADLLALAFAMLLEPNTDDTPVFDTAGDDILEMADLAAHVRKSLDRPDLPIERPPMIKGNEDIYVGDNKIMKRQMQGRGIDLRRTDEQIRDTAAFMRGL
jgi:nucleoside-diphosphate-sugar epimerase